MNSFLIHKLFICRLQNVLPPLTMAFLERLAPYVFSDTYTSQIPFKKIENMSLKTSKKVILSFIGKMAHKKSALPVSLPVYTVSQSF